MSDVVDSLLDQIRSVGVAQSPEINQCWRDQLARLPAALANPSRKSIRKAIGYNTERLPKGWSSNRDWEQWATLMAAVESESPEGLGAFKGLQDHAGQLIYLKRLGLLHDYIAWIDGQRLLSDLNLARHFHYREKLRPLLAPMDAYLEIGGGSGRFALMISELRLTSHVILVDLPEMLLNAAMLIEEERPDVRLRLNQPPDLSDPPTFWLLETNKIELAPDRRAGAAVNINSFMEMDREVRDFYIGQIYRILRPGGVFFNVNRHHKQMGLRDGSLYENNPLLYPYRPDDEVIEWEVERGQILGRVGAFRLPNTFPISRIARVR